MQVWFKDRMVGEARVRVPGHGAREIRMPVADDMPVFQPGKTPDDALLPVAVRNVVLPLDYAMLRITDEAILMNGPDYPAVALARHNVRESDCEVFVDHASYSKTYRWKIIRATLPLLEEIIDYDWFEPTDGPPDPDYMMSRCLAERV